MFSHPDFLLLNIGHTFQNADWNWRDVSSPFARIFYVISGEAWLHENGNSTHLLPGNLYFIPPFTVHSYQCDGPFELYYLHIIQRTSSSHDGITIFDRYDFPTHIPTDTDHIEPILKYVAGRHEELKLINPDPKTYDTHSQMISYAQRYDSLSIADRMMIQGLILSIMSMIIEKASVRQWAHDIRMIKIAEYIANHLSGKIDIPLLAREVRLSTDYFIKLFKSNFGLTPIKYINRKRLQQACMLLITTDNPIKQISYTVGYDDPSYFTRQFTAMTGCSPYQYRHNTR